MSSLSYRRKLITEPRYLKEGVKEMWLSSETWKSSAWGHDEYFSLRMDYFLVAFGLEGWVTCDGVEGGVDEVMRGVLM